MFKAVLIQWIYVRCDNNTKGAFDGKRWACKLEHEFDLPFVPERGMLFYDGDDEVDVEEVHYDLREAVFNVEVGGQLCEDDGEVRMAVNHELSKGWKITKKHRTLSIKGGDDDRSTGEHGGESGPGGPDRPGGEPLDGKI